MYFYACKKQVNILSNIAENEINFSVTKTTPNAQQLAADPDFKEFDKISWILSGNSQKPEVDYIYDGEMSPIEFQLLSKAMGYADSTGFKSGIDYQQYLSVKLNQKFILLPSSISGAITVLHKTAKPSPCTNCGILPPPSLTNRNSITASSFQLNSAFALKQGPCDKAFDICMSSANSDYYKGVLNCAFEGAGIGTVFTHVVGLIYVAGCGLFEIHDMKLAKAKCQTDYNNCN